MSTKHAELLHAVQKGKQMYAAFAEGEALLQTLTGLEQNERELVIACTRLRKENEVALHELNNARLEASKLAEKAKSDAARIVSNARASAASTVGAAETEAKRVSQEAASFVNEATTARDHLKAESDNLSASIVVGRTILAELNDKIAKAKAAAAEIARG